jgi:hypothetical protein
MANQAVKERELPMQNVSRTKRIAAASALVLAGLGAGVVIATTGSASAADQTGASSTSTSDTTDQSKPQRPDEKLLTGTTATKVKDAALAKYPGATIERVETDSDGVYEAHIVTKAGDRVIVQVYKSFAVTGTQTGGGHGDKDGDRADSSSS